MEFNDILGLGKVLPLDKLVGVLEKGIGRVTKSYFDRIDINNEALKIRKLAEARVDAIKMIGTAINENVQLSSHSEYDDKVIKISSTDEMRAIPDLSLEERTGERIKFQNYKSQLNIESIANFAADELKKEESVSNETLNDDWITRFFKIAEDVSNEEMQALWGRILAGEVKRPNSFSIRTLELIKNISKEEAEVFMRIANYAITQDMKSYFIFKGAYTATPQFELPFKDLTLLKEIGLLHSVDLVSKTFTKVEINTIQPFLFGRDIILIKRDEVSPLLTVQIELFTTSGNELLGLIDKTMSSDYLKAFTLAFNHPSVKIWKGLFLKLEDNKFYHEDLTPLDFEN